MDRKEAVFQQDMKRKEAEIRNLREEMDGMRKQLDKLVHEKASIAADNAKEIVVACH